MINQFWLNKKGEINSSLHLLGDKQLLSFLHLRTSKTLNSQYLNGTRSYNFKSNLNLPTHYTLALKNHENFSYGERAQQGHRPGQNFQQHYASPGFQQQQQGSQRAENQGQRRSSSFEEQMLTFMGENKRLLNIHELKFADLAAFQANTVVFQANTNASLKNLETQVGKLALAM